MNIIKSSESYTSHQGKVNLAIQDWSYKSACISKLSSEDFFDAKDSNLHYLAQKYCFYCPVQAKCLYTSLVNQEQHGLWGGLTSRQRRLYLKTVLHVAEELGIPIDHWTPELDEIIKKYSDPDFLKEVFAF